MIISIGGPGGSGKSSIAKMLAEKLAWPRYYIGGLRRMKAEERGITLAEYNKLGETDPATDREVDEYQAELGKDQDNFIIEGRTSWYFIPQSLKIYIDVDAKEGAARIFNSLSVTAKERNEDKDLVDLASVFKSTSQRKASDILRYKKYYGIDVYDKKNYDIVIDSTGKTLAETFQEVLSQVEKRLKSG
jgi:CMP/dCMP kinase